MDKIKVFVEYLHENEIKKAVILKKENINYFLERYPPNFSVLVFEGEEGILYVPKLDYEMAKKYEKDNLRVEIFEKWEDIFEGCDGIEETLPIKFLKHISKDYKIISDKIKEMRMIKNKSEIKLIKNAAEISDKAVKYIMENLENIGNKTENELAAEIEYVMKKNGSIRPSFDTIVISDKKTSYPHELPSNEIIKNILLVDIGAVYEGYCSDITRTFLLNPSKKMEEVYDIVSNAKKEVEKHLKEGVSAKELDEIAREFMGEYKEYFIHSLGHGVGVEVHESPTLSIKAKEDVVLKEGMVLTIEPGIYLKDEFGVRIEDLYLVKKNGFKKLSNAKY
ncbi:M24 family metallopeptidase [Methanotorris igneus]|uniref:Xaa-Pro dipeptidase n=1 Tax=Methanotorris igneus (strain DSM 5666 / JCM 11834 / Kol 5) TaxID=880724 RepID=F6BAU1_METIK|nr:Xaa-Pro peptidase family protein [Methanotorris igneus]AEF95905.1 Xaa-Pro dipeptidase [Methanotorris igneus Kol 5]